MWSLIGGESYYYSLRGIGLFVESIQLTIIHSYITTRHIKTKHRGQ
jgi:hypothetical protein